LFTWSISLDQWKLWLAAVNWKHLPWSIETLAFVDLKYLSDPSKLWPVLTKSIFLYQSKYIIFAVEEKVHQLRPSALDPLPGARFYSSRFRFCERTATYTDYVIWVLWNGSVERVFLNKWILGLMTTFIQR
jgi:hypothetical protein